MNRDKNNVSRPFRWVGPYPKWEAELLAAKVVESVRLETALLDYAKGDMEPHELMYEIQSIFERAEEEQREAEAAASYPLGRDRA